MSGVWTNNYAGYKASAALGLIKDGWATVINTSGTSISYSGPGTYSPVQGQSFGASGTIRLGTGANVTPSATDVNLVTPLTASAASFLGITARGLIYDPDTRTVTQKYTMTLRRDAESPITITEYGLFWAYGASSGYAMMYHGTFDSPITLNQYDTAVFELEVSVTLDELV